MRTLDDLFEFLMTTWPPNGYKLVEDKDHKINRLKEEIASKKGYIELLTKLAASNSEDVMNLEKKLADLTSDTS